MDSLKLVKFLIYGAVGGGALLVFFSFVVWPKEIEAYNERKAYEAIEMYNGENFNGLADQEDAFKKIKVFRSTQYPCDKQVVISDKKDGRKTILFIENDNGKAKVVDVNVDGKQIVFK